MKVSAVLAVRDEAAMIQGALRTVAFCDEIVVIVDDRSSDETEALAREHTPHVHRVAFTGFGELKNEGVRRATGEWIVFCDGDERLTPRLASQLMEQLDAGTDCWAFRSPTINFFWGRRMEHGGWVEDHIKIVRRDHALHEGEIHEQLQVPPDRVGWLPGERWHFSHRSIVDNLAKTILYGGLDADERLAARRPPVTRWRLLLGLLLEFGRRMVRRSGWRDGMPGLIEGFYQPFALFCTSVMLWERQNQETIARGYAELDRAVLDER